jgi:hypothetical protein
VGIYTGDFARQAEELRLAQALARQALERASPTPPDPKGFVYDRIKYHVTSRWSPIIPCWNCQCSSYVMLAMAFGSVRGVMHCSRCSAVFDALLDYVGGGHVLRVAGPIDPARGRLAYASGLTFAYKRKQMRWFERIGWWFARHPLRGRPVLTPRELDIIKLHGWWPA